MQGHCHCQPKGGLGKTTTCANLGIGLAQEGKRILLVDSDPQGSLSISLGFTEPDKLPYTLSTAMTQAIEDQPLTVAEGIDTYNTGESRGREVSHSLNYQKLGKELMSIDELAVLDGGKCILQLRGVRPFLSDKYDITKHPNYRYTADFDERNAFDVQKYLQHRLKLKENEVYSVYEEDLTTGKE